MRPIVWAICTFPLILLAACGGGSDNKQNNQQQAAPVPTLTSISPSSVAPGSSSFTLTANGSGFTQNSTLLWNGNARQTAYVSNVQLTAQIEAADVTAGGTFPVSVSTPSPGGGVTQFLNLNVQYPLPNISSLSPNGALIQGPGFPLTVFGTNFYPGATVSWNHIARVTTLVSATQLTASILSDDLNVASGTTADVYTTNPSPSAGISNTVPFLLENPVPTISAMTPNTGLAGDHTSIQITGTNFINGATVQVEGQSLNASVMSSTSLQASIQVSKVGSSAITVTNAAPNAGPSSPVQFESKAAGNPMNPQLVIIDQGGQAVSLSRGLRVSGAGRYISFSHFMRDTCLGVSSGCTPYSLPLPVESDVTYTDFDSIPSDDGRFVAILGSSSVPPTAPRRLIPDRFCFQGYSG
jgi:hypothetical protein